MQTVLPSKSFGAALSAGDQRAGVQQPPPKPRPAAPQVLSLDINSNAVGFAFGSADDGKPRVGTWRLSGGGDDLPRSSGGLYSSISELAKLIHPKIVAIEAPLRATERSAQTAYILTVLFGAAMAAAHNAGARAIPVHVQSWRKTFCGHGRPENPKQATQDRCRLLGWKFEGDDEADAIGIWVHQMSLSFPAFAPKSTPLFSERAG